jgi:hypothetical protein
VEAADKKSRIIEISVPQDIDEKWVKSILENAIIDRLVKESRFKKAREIILSLGLKPSDVLTFDKMRDEIWAQRKKLYGL